MRFTRHWGVAAVALCVTVPEFHVTASKLLVANGRVTNEHEEVVADVLIDNGKVVAVGQNLAATPAASGAKVIDATGKYVLPGGIDPHTHLAMPFMGQVACDDFSSGHKAALAGGTTMHLDFVLPVDGSLLKGYEEWQRKGKKANMDFGFHMAVTSWNEQIAREMEILVKEKGVNSFKFFMAYKGALMINDEQLLEAFAKCRELGALAMVHAENGDAVAAGQRYVIEELGITGPHGHALSRPDVLEEEATNRAIQLAKFVGTPLYVVHVMSKLAMEAVARGRASGARVFGEPTVAGLVLDESMMWHPDFKVAAAHVMSPPIRKRDVDGKALRQALKARVLQLVATDHAVFNSTQKRAGLKDFRILPNGVNGLEERIPVLWREMVKSGQITARDFARITSTEAARLFNVYPRKGVIAPGSDADLYVLDPEASVTVSAATHHSAIDTNVFEGYSSAKIETTISRGELAWHEGKLHTTDGVGQFVVTPPWAPIAFEGLDADMPRFDPNSLLAQGYEGKATQSASETRKASVEL